MGNLLSITRAFEHCGADVEVTTSAAKIEAAERLVVPGVGAFADCMNGIRANGFAEPIRHYAASGRPLLGICVGMQVFMDVGEEFGTHEGLGLIPGKVAAIPAAGADGKPLKIPHVGWSGLQPVGPGWTGSIFSHLKPGDAAYFVHSYAVVAEDPLHTLAEVDYGGWKITAAVHSQNIYGCQFHPEKSGPVGLGIIQAFCSNRKI
jgi:glutamine amidotransferase